MINTILSDSIFLVTFGVLFLNVKVSIHVVLFLPRLFIWLVLFYPFSFFLFIPLSFVQSKTCSFSFSILCTSFSYVIIFLHHFCQAAISFKISNLIICFHSFDLSCPIHEKKNNYQFFKYFIVLF